MTVSVSDLVRPARTAMVVSGVLTGTGAVVGVVPFAALTQLAALWLGETRTGLSAWGWIGVAAAALCASQMLYMSGLGVTHLAEARLRRRLRQQIVDQINHLPLGSVARLPHGTIRKMVCDDTTAIHTLVAHIPGDVTAAIVGVLAGGAYLVWVDWRLALTLFGVWLVAGGLVLGLTARGLTGVTERFGVAQTRISAATVEMLEGIAEIKGFQATDTTRTRFHQARRDFSEISYEWVRASGRPMAVLNAMLRPATVFVLVAVLAVVFTRQGWTPLWATLPFFLLAPGLPDGVSTVMGLLQHVYESRMAAQSSAAVLSQERMPAGEYDEGDGPAPGRVEVEDVSFEYEPGKPVLRGVTLRAEPGTVTALVGPSGSGKSTLARLIARFYDVGAGCVRVSGVDVREASFAWLLSRVAVVLQDVALSNDSVLDNIRLGKPGASMDEVVAAAKAALIHDRVMRLPQGYDTVLGAEGGFLSGGEKQRVTLARAYLQDAPVLVLDEATAQADPESERDLHETLSRLAQGRTVIMIAHRLATVRDADQILVLDEGEVVERGRHDELVAAQGRYAALWASQDLSLVEGE